MTTVVAKGDGRTAVPREPGTGKFPGRQERRVAVTGLAPPAVGTKGGFGPLSWYGSQIKGQGPRLERER